MHLLHILNNILTWSKVEKQFFFFFFFFYYKLLLLSHFSRVQLCETHPWDSPGNNTGVGCHFLLQCIKVKSDKHPTLKY